MRRSKLIFPNPSLGAHRAVYLHQEVTSARSPSSSNNREGVEGLMSSSTAITWQSWSRKWGDWTTWAQSRTTTRTPVHGNLRVAPVTPQRQMEKPQNSTKLSDQV